MWASSLCVVALSAALAVTAFGTMNAIRASTPAPSPVTYTGNPLTTVSPAPPAHPPTPKVAVIGGICQPHGDNGKTADGSVAHCERLERTEIFMWSLYTGDIVLRADSASVVAQYGSSVAVCMEQTERTADDCIGYLKLPGGPTAGP